MAAIIETGDAINIHNFKRMIDYCTAFGDKYNPSNEAIKVENMLAKYEIAYELLVDYTRIVQQSKAPINERRIVFNPAGRLITRSLKYYESTLADPEAKKDAKGLCDMFRGTGKFRRKPKNEEGEFSGISTSHLSYVQRENTLRNLVAFYKADPKYNPNEGDLKIEALEALLSSMKELNDGIGTVIGRIEIARNRKNAVIYAAEEGIIDVSLMCKRYVNGLFGAGSENTRMVTRIRFHRRIRRFERSNASMAI